MQNHNKIIESVKFNDNGLVPAIAKDSKTNEVLMMAWMNAEALRESLETNRMCYYSKSKNKLWRKDEQSGQTEMIKDIKVGCDSDSILAIIDKKDCTINSDSIYKAFDNDNLPIEQEIQKLPEVL